MSRRLTVIIEKEGSGYVAICLELEVASPGDSVEEAHSNLKKALELTYGAAPPEEGNGETRREMYLTQVEVPVP